MGFIKCGFMSKKISVILTNFNHKQYIETAFDSIYNQSYQNLELIIVDDCSTDGSLETIKTLEKRNDKFPIKSIALQQNKGKWNALNVGILAATGELITLQDADDASHQYRLEIQYEAMQTKKSFHNLCGFSHCYTEEDIQKYKNEEKFPSPRVMEHSTVTRNVHQGFKTPGINHYYVGPDFEAHGATCLFYRQLWENGIKFLPGNMGLRCVRAEDSDFNTKMTLLFQKTSIVMEPLYFYRRNSSTNPAWLEEL